MTGSADDELIAHLDEPVSLECEGAGHAAGTEGHVPGQSGEYSLNWGCPLCGDRLPIVVCTGRYNWMIRFSSAAKIKCDKCHRIRGMKSYMHDVVNIAPPRVQAASEKPAKRVATPASAPKIPQRSRWESALAEFELFEQAKGLSSRTIENRRWTLSGLAKTADDDPSRVTIEDLRGRLARGISRSSMQTETDTYRAFFRFLADSGARKDDLGAQLPAIRAPKRKPRPYTREQIEALLNGGYSHTRAMILLAFFQGFRASEVAAVQGRDIDLAMGTIRVIGKGGKHATLPLHPAIAALAASMPHEGYWFPARRGRDGHIHSRSVSDLMRRAKLRAGIDNERLTGHSLRHSYGTELVRAGVDLRTVQELMRHESLATTQIYTAIDAEQMRRGINRLGSMGADQPADEPQ